MNIMDMDEHLAFLRSLPEDTEKGYTSGMLQKANENAFDENILKEILKSNNDEKIKFGAFYTLITMYREEKNYSKMEKLINDYKSNTYYAEKPLFINTLSVIHKKKLTINDARLSIQLARDAISKIKDKENKNPGFYQNFADAVLLALEYQLINDKNNELIEEAESSIKQAIEIDPDFAKYYATYGRLLLQKKEFNTAKANIVKAINKEDSKGKFYPLRITEYEDILTRCSLAQTLTEVEKNKEKIEEEYSKLRNSVIEFIGFFAAIVAMIVSTVTITAQVNAADSIRILGFLYSGMIVAMACLKYSLDTNERPKIVALILVCVAIVFAILTFVLVHFIL